MTTQYRDLPSALRTSLLAIGLVRRDGAIDLDDLRRRIATAARLLLVEDAPKSGAGELERKAEEAYAGVFGASRVRLPRKATGTVKRRRKG